MESRIFLQTGATPTAEEIATVNFLIDLNFARQITFLAASKIEGTKTPDIVADGVRWEIKCPVGRGVNTIKHSFEMAIQQSNNIIFDLRHSRLPDEANIARLKKEFRDIRKVKKLVVITKTRKMLVFSK